jgi:hypothetical protein
VPTGYAPQPGHGPHVARPGLLDGGPAAAAIRTGRSQGGPARGYPPLPGDPGPRYPQREFAAWNEPETPAPQTFGDLPFAAPTWSDTGSFDQSRPGAGGRGVALAERAGDDLAGLSDDDIAAWAASLTDAQVAAPEEPLAAAAGGGPGTGESTTRLPQPDAERPDTEPTPDRGMRRAAERTRSATTRARKSARRKVRTRRRVVVAGICVPAIAVVAVMALQHPGGQHPGGQHSTGQLSSGLAASGHAAANAPASHALSAASSAGPAALSLGTWQHIATRAGDPAPLTLSQLFPAQFAVGSAGYTRTVQLGSADCSGAVFGKKLQAAVRKYGCSQVMRASYLAPAQKLMGTIGVLNLADAADASKVGKVTGSSEFVAQLTAASGPTRSLTKGTGLEEAEVKGHYLILTWAEFTNHRAPRTRSEKAQLKAFSAELISRTANVSLTSRMVTGQPQIP